MLTAHGIEYIALGGEGNCLDVLTIMDEASHEKVLDVTPVEQYVLVKLHAPSCGQPQSMPVTGDVVTYLPTTGGGHLSVHE